MNVYKSLEINKDQEEAFVGLNKLFGIIDIFLKIKKLSLKNIINWISKQLKNL